MRGEALDLRYATDPPQHRPEPHQELAARDGEPAGRLGPDLVTIPPRQRVAQDHVDLARQRRMRIVLL